MPIESKMDSDIIPRPALSASKQNRILIWRDEVASAVDTLDAASAADDITPSFTSTSSTTSASSTASPPLSRPRNLWKRLSRRLSRLGRGGDSLADLDRSPRTAMYREVPAAVALAALNGASSPNNDAEIKRADEMLLGGESSDGRPGGLKEKQERLERAARLLQQGPNPDE